MISWKHSFERINEEYEIVKRKKQALDNLLSNGKISQSTYDSFNQEMNDAIAEIEGQQKALLEKMNSKVNELEQQVKILEMLLANFEIQHATGEIDEDLYQRKTELLSTGLEAARQELDVTKEAVNEFSGGIQTTEAVMPPPPPETIEPQEIEAQPAEEVTAIQSEVETTEETTIQPEAEPTEETVLSTEPDEAEVESEGSEETEGESEVAEEAEEEVEENLPEYSSVSVEETSEVETFENPQETLQNPEESESTEVEEEKQEE